MAQNKKTTKKTTTTKKKTASKKASAPKAEKKTEALNASFIGNEHSALTVAAAKVWESPKPFVPQKKKNWLKRLFPAFF